MDNAQIFTLANNVAAELGEGWSAVGPPEGESWPPAELRHADGRTVQVEQSGARLWLQGTLPSLPDGVSNGALNWSRYPQREREISVNAARSAAQVAREINQRLLPAYGAQLARHSAEVAALVAGLAARDVLRGELAEALGLGSVPAGAGVTWAPTTVAGAVTFEVSGSGQSVELRHAHVDPYTAVCVARLLADIGAKGPITPGGPK